MGIGHAADASQERPEPERLGGTPEELARAGCSARSEPLSLGGFKVFSCYRGAAEVRRVKL